MKTKFCWLYPLAFAACGTLNPAAATPSTEKEIFAVCEVARLAKKLHKDIKGIISPETKRVAAGTGGCPADAPKGYCNAAAWYIPPVVFWQEYVNRESTTFSDLTNTAAHEVCHSVTFQHDQLLWNCILNLGADPQFAPHE